MNRDQYAAWWEAEEAAGAQETEATIGLTVREPVDWQTHLRVFEASCEPRSPRRQAELPEVAR